MIVGTAGHIDHGKTSLVRRFTGVDTDRLKEKKARGISIDLGFAYWTRPSGETIGFVGDGRVGSAAPELLVSAPGRVTLQQLLSKKTQPSLHGVLVR